MSEGDSISCKKKIRDRGAHRRARESVEKQTGVKISPEAGLGNTLGDVEWVPTYRRAPGEQQLAQHNNSWILLGKDRFAAVESGWGGRGAQACASIDLVVGMGNSQAGDVPDNVDILGSTGVTGANVPVVGLIYDKNFKTDAARIYISQMADIDRYFDINPEAPSGIPNSEGRSAVGIKADAIRIIGREGIRLLTRTERKNSQGCKIDHTAGIELVAGGDTGRLQPLVLGNNMARALQKLVDLVGQLATNVDKLGQKTQQMAVDLSLHIHPTAPPGPPSTALGPIDPINGDPIDTPMAMLGISNDIHHIRRDVRATRKRLSVGWKKTYASQGGQYYINSQYNKVN